MPDLYVCGVPMALGDYYRDSCSAATTYAYSYGYARAQLNGERTELTLYRFAKGGEGNTPAIHSPGSLLLILDGDNYIDSENAPTIKLDNGSMEVLNRSSTDEGRLFITAEGSDGIQLSKGSYYQTSGIINITAQAAGVNVYDKKVEITGGELNIESGTYGISCNKFSMSGGKLLACGNTRAIDETMGFNYSPLPIFASTSPSGTLGTYKYANHNSYKVISIGYTTAPVLSIPGDVDNDGDVDLDDAIYLLYHVNFKETYPVGQSVDFNGDGGDDLDDTIYLLYHVNFKETYPLH